MLERLFKWGQGIAPTVVKFLAYLFILCAIGFLLGFLATPAVVLLSVITVALAVFCGLERYGS